MGGASFDADTGVNALVGSAVTVEAVDIVESAELSVVGLILFPLELLMLLLLCGASGGGADAACGCAWRGVGPAAAADCA